jgi:type IV secretion system protein VirB9
MILRRLALSLVVAGLVPLAPLRAEVTPQPGQGDAHIQFVAYDANQVVALHVAAGFAVTIRFAPDERIETVALGDTVNWTVQSNKRGDLLTVKSNGGGANTNLNVITDSRAYNFTLYGGISGEAVTPYQLNFLYPAPATPAAAAAPQPTGRYHLSGDKALWPSEMSDDGRFTRIRWPQSAMMPAVYAASGWGRRALINGVVEDGVYVIDGIYPRLAFVLGRASAVAKRLKPAPEDDAKGTP